MKILRFSMVAIISKSSICFLAALTKPWQSSPRLLVAGSVGPYGAYLADGSEYRGDYTVSVDEMKDFHRPRIQALGEITRNIKSKLSCTDRKSTRLNSSY